MNSSHRGRRVFLYGAALAALVVLGLALPAEAQDANRGRVALEAARQDRVVNLASNITVRLTAATGRYGDIVARLEARIEKMAGEGKDTGAASLKLHEAKQSLVKAITALSSLGSVKNAVSGDTPRESFKVIRENMLSIREELRTTHTLLRETVDLLKAAAQSGAQGASDAVREGNV